MNADFLCVQGEWWEFDFNGTYLKNMFELFLQMSINAMELKIKLTQFWVGYWVKTQWHIYVGESKGKEMHFH